MHKTFFLVILLSLFAGFLWQIGLNLQVYKVGTYIYKDSVILENPLPDEFITTPLVIKGKARGDWFFEGSFPVILTNEKGEIISKGFATTQNNEKTKKFVPFEAVLEFVSSEKTESVNKKGFLILKKNSSSDLSKYDDVLKIPVRFKYPELQN